MVTLATLIEEILLTRIFSVTMWYHFVFLAISVTMFGLTVGGLLVYLAPRYFTGNQAKKRVYAGVRIFAGITFVIFALYLRYHLFYAASSVALFGLGLGGLVMYLAPDIINSRDKEKHLFRRCAGLAVTTAGSFLVYLAIPPVFHMTVTGVLSLATILG